MLKKSFPVQITRNGKRTQIDTAEANQFETIDEAYDWINEHAVKDDETAEDVVLGLVNSWIASREVQKIRSRYTGPLSQPELVQAAMKYLMKEDAAKLNQLLESDTLFEWAKSNRTTLEEWYTNRRLEPLLENND